MKHFVDNQGNLYAYELDGSQDHLIGDKTPVSADQAEAISQQKTQEKFGVLTYAEKRRAEYPAIGDQLDAVWKGGADAEAMRAQIMAVKAKYPK